MRGMFVHLNAGERADTKKSQVTMAPLTIFQRNPRNVRCVPHYCNCWLYVRSRLWSLLRTDVPRWTCRRLMTAHVELFVKCVDVD